MKREDAKTLRDEPGRWAGLGALGVFAFFLTCLLLGCAPKRPDPALVLWEQPAPEIAAKAHAREKGFSAHPVLPTGSMEPMITGGDWVVIDPTFPWEKLEESDVIAYVPDWTPLLVLHACAARSGEGWIVHGLANAHYENGLNGGLHVFARHYRGKLVQVYTTRKK